MPGIKWTAAQDAMLKQMAASGAFSYEIADAIGRSRDAVKTRACRLGVDMRRCGQFDRVAEKRRGMSKEWKDTNKVARLAGYAEKRHLFEERRVAAIRRARCLKLYPGLPEHLWGEVVKLRVVTTFSSREAYEIIMNDWRRQVLAALREICRAASDYARVELAKRNTFEAQLERVRTGQARVVPTFNRSRVLSEHRSLIGGTMAEIAA